MSAANPAVELSPRPLNLVGCAATGVALCGVMGAGVNAINGWVSPEYFVVVLRWQGVADVWRASIAQGILEGLLTGLLFSLIFTTTVGIVTGAVCTYGFAIRHLLGIAVGAVALSLLGGLAAMGLATLSPEFYRRAFIGVPPEFGDMLRYAWVGGSLVGLQLGGFVSLVVGLVWLRANWLEQIGAGSTPAAEAEK